MIVFRAASQDGVFAIQGQVSIADFRDAASGLEVTPTSVKIDIIINWNNFGFVGRSVDYVGALLCF